MGDGVICVLESSKGWGEIIFMIGMGSRRMTGNEEENESGTDKIHGTKPGRHPER